MPPAAPDATSRAIDAVWRIESAKVIAGVARMVRDVGVAEELAQDALVAALEHWPADGVPDNPGAWLMRTAKNRALDRLRQDALHARKHEELSADREALQAHVTPDFVDALAEASEDDIGDDLLRLMFTACHPLLPTEGRVALTLRLIGGLATDEIARAFLVPEATVAQRIVRAKRSLRRRRSVRGARAERARAASGVGAGSDLPGLQRRLSATAGDDWMRPRSATRRCASAASSLGSRPARARCTAWSR
jgi:RNA polymerase sigma factor (sigma-70 family)